MLTSWPMLWSRRLARRVAGRRTSTRMRSDATTMSWTEMHVRGEDPHSTTSVIELAGEAVGRLRIVRDGQRIELSGIQLRPRVQGRGIGTAVIDDLKSEAARTGLP